MLNQIGNEEALQRNKLSRSGRAGLSLICEECEILLDMAPVTMLDAGNGVVCFREPGQKLRIVAAVRLDGQAAFAHLKAPRKLL